MYYGVSGHSKGLVDSMTSFGVKGPLEKSIITENFFFNDVEQVKEHLEQKHLDKPNWVYRVASEDHLAERRKQPREEFKILQCQKLHNCFFPRWSSNGKRKSLFLPQMSKWKFGQM